MIKLYIALVLALIWAVLIVKEAGSEDVLACYENASYRSESTQEMVLRMVEEAGFDPVIANKVIDCESGWNPDARGDSGNSWGLWQIHQPAHNLGSASFDPYLSTVYAIKLMQSERGLNHWSCYQKLF